MPVMFSTNLVVLHVRHRCKENRSIFVKESLRHFLGFLGQFQPLLCRVHSTFVSTLEELHVLTCILVCSFMSQHQVLCQRLPIFKKQNFKFKFKFVKFQQIPTCVVLFLLLFAPYNTQRVLNILE